MQTPRAFTVIELLVAVSVIGIISAIVSSSLTESRTRARDANRTESVRSYSQSMEQWKTVNGTYFVYNKPVDATLPTCTAPEGVGYMSCTAPTSTDNRAGYLGGGAGGITRKSVTDYTETSIAEVLLKSGYLSQIRLDPLDPSFSDRTTSTSGYADFILTLCKPDSNPATSPSTATEYAIFAHLERAEPVSQDIANTHCGGPTTPSDGWDTTIAR
jgi:prepilin-type N-terminal cleavage/methylation domain-containing protein